MIQKIAVLGLGKVGSLVATLLSSKYKITGIDQSQFLDNFSFDVENIDVSDAASIRQVLKNMDAVVSCLPYFLNIKIAEIAVQMGVHYFDLTEDVPTLHAIQKMSSESHVALVPQCGLAPGFIGILGAGLYQSFSKI